MKETCQACPKYKAIFAPVSKCKTCWSKYFNTHRATTAMLEAFFRKNAMYSATMAFGSRMVKAFNELRKDW